MASWGTFLAADEELGPLASARVGDFGLVMLGTLRANGWPRVSPVAALDIDGQLYIGMMWQSKKALDLLRDPRCVVHSVTVDPDGGDGDVKIYGNALDVTDPDAREAYCVEVERRIHWRPEGDFHLFAVDIEEVGYFRSQQGVHDVKTWRPPPDDPSVPA